MSATVNPHKLKEALNAKIGTARQSVYELRQADAPEFNRYSDPQAVVVTLLHAARGVFPTAMTFAEGQSTADFDAWYRAWLAGLSSADRTLWDLLRDERVAQEHGDGAGLIQVGIPITRGPGGPEFSGNAALGIPATRSEVSKGGVRFAAYAHRPASDVCAEMLRVCERFVADFTRDHAHLIP